MSDALQRSYDAVPYPDKPRPATHPDHLAALARLAGLDPAPARRCRVLELGCAAGANLWPMAQYLPDSEFVGVDFSPVQVENGRRVVADLGLKNLTLRAASILDVDESWGTFDYVLCHGVFSWVPREVQDAILSICARQLAPQGVAYVSYNTLPGWHVRLMLREMVAYHAGQYSDDEIRRRQGLAFFDVLRRSAGARGSALGEVVAGVLNRLADMDPSYVVHEYLEDVNAPLYFHEFAGRAAAHGLQYVDDASPDPDVGRIAPDTLRELDGLTDDPIRREQYADFLANRVFRSSVLCRAGLTLNRRPGPAELSGLYLTGTARQQGPPDAAGVQSFMTENGAVVSSGDPSVKALLHRLRAHWPRPVPYAELRDAVFGAAGEEAFAQFILLARKVGLLTLHSEAPPELKPAGERPVAVPLVRCQAADGSHVTSRFHRWVELGPFERALLARLDGSRDRSALAKELQAAAGNPDPTRLAADVEKLLKGMALHGVLAD